MPLDSKKTWNACGEAFDRYTTAEDSYSDNIERPAIEQLIGEVSGQSALDLGCGSGTYSVWIAGRGAQVVGFDLSEAMLLLAKKRASEQGAQLDLGVVDINGALPAGDCKFDLVFTATALHYVENLEALMREIARALKPGGRLVASVLHPMSTARFPVAEIDSVDRRWDSRSNWQSSYFGHSRRLIETPWLAFGSISDGGHQISCYHHTTHEYFATVQAAGLVLTDLSEPQPPKEFARKNPARYEEATATPVYLMFKAHKQFN